jgi:hypothetical protein
MECSMFGIDRKSISWGGTRRRSPSPIWAMAVVIRFQAFIPRSLMITPFFSQSTVLSPTINQTGVASPKESILKRKWIPLGSASSFLVQNLAVRILSTGHSNLTSWTVSITRIIPIRNLRFQITTIARGTIGPKQAASPVPRTPIVGIFGVIPVSVPLVIHTSKSAINLDAQVLAQTPARLFKAAIARLRPIFFRKFLQWHA